MICKNCNAEINDNSKFCTECGNEVSSSNQFSLFSPAGCVSRKTYWAIISVSIGVPVLLAFIMVFTVVTLSDVLKFDYSTTGKDLLIVMLAVPSILLWWVTIVTSLKRLRDANFSAWLYLLNLIPYLGTLIIFILNGFFPSVEEGNKYCKSKNNLSSKAIKWIYTIFLAPILLILVLIGVGRLTNDSSVADNVNGVEEKVVTKTDNTKTPTYFNPIVNTTPSYARVMTTNTIDKDEFTLTIITQPKYARIRIMNIEEKYYDGIHLKKLDLFKDYKVKIDKKGYITRNINVSLPYSLNGKNLKIYVQLYPQEKIELNSQKVIILNSLMWQDDVNSRFLRKNWIDAKNYCHNLSLNGYHDWRLPSIDELGSIKSSIGYSDPSIKKEFKNAKSSYYWSSSSRDNWSASTTPFQFNTVDSYGYSKKSKLYLRCVREY